MCFREKVISSTSMIDSVINWSGKWSMYSFLLPPRSLLAPFLLLQSALPSRYSRRPLNSLLQVDASIRYACSYVRKYVCIMEIRAVVVLLICASGASWNRTQVSGSSCFLTYLRTGGQLQLDHTILMDLSPPVPRRLTCDEVISIKIFSYIPRWLLCHRS